MNSKSNAKFSRDRTTSNVHGGGPNWVLIACGALLGTLSIRTGCKIKQVLLDRRPTDAGNLSKGHARANPERRSGACPLHSDAYCFTHDDDRCCHCVSGVSEGSMEAKHVSSEVLSRNTDLLPGQLAIVTSVPTESSDLGEKEASATWASSPERLELPRRPFHHQSAGSDSPCVSECGSDLFSKREVIHRLRQQLKRRDEMIIEMQARITEQQRFLSERMMHASHLQSQLDAANRELLEAEREIQRLRKAIVDHCPSADARSHHDQLLSGNRQKQNGYANGVAVGLEARSMGAVSIPLMAEGKEADGERVEALKREVAELREVIEGKDYLLHSYKEQKMELCSKVQELQLRLDSQVPNIL
ncbi:hypothetical protein EJ110_NYTH04193 [Nymphaea thermarum]|nr:hypothetical protein EJ110_NYTH04193 [Nymphaea thermarum]